MNANATRAQRRGLDKALFQSLLTAKWITDKRNLIITGPCGVGKTWLGCALAQAACRDGVTVVYKTDATALRRNWNWPMVTGAFCACSAASPRRNC